MADAPTVQPPSAAPPKRRSVRDLAIALAIALVITVALVAFASNRGLVDGISSAFSGITSPVAAGATLVNLSVGSTPVPTPTVTTNRSQVVVPGTGTRVVPLSLKSGDQVVGVYDAADQVDFSLWLLTVPRQRLLQQVQVQGESTFSWTATASGDYMIQFTSPRDTTVSLAYAVKGP